MRTFPVTVTCGTVVTLRSVRVRDTFDDETELGTPTDWTLFAVDGLEPGTLVVWPTVATPLTGPALGSVLYLLGTALFRLKPGNNVQTRDVSMVGVEWEGAAATHFFEPVTDFAV